jgi:dynein heavy chain, axonemal
MLTGQDPTDYSKITDEAKKFQPFFNLWTTVDNWRISYKSWLHDSFEDLNAQKLEETVDNSNKTMAQVIRLFRDKELPGIMKIAETIKNEVEEFKPFVPLAVSLRTQGMKERHWNAISEKVGFEVKPFEGFTFNNCIEMELQKFTEICVDIGEKAGKEYNIETSMSKMKKDWEGIEFRLIPFKNTGTYSVAGFDDAMAMLDEHIVLTQTMQFSPFKKPFEAEIEEWNASLLYVSECIDEWIKCQGQWMYLQPIFDSPDIMKQLPSENKKFKNVDKNWREVIAGTKTNPNVLKSCTREGLLEKF